MLRVGRSAPVLREQHELRAQRQVGCLVQWTLETVDLHRANVDEAVLRVLMITRRRSTVRASGHAKQCSRTNGERCQGMSERTSPCETAGMVYVLRAHTSNEPSVLGLVSVPVAVVAS